MNHLIKLTLLSLLILNLINSSTAQEEEGADEGETSVDKANENNVQKSDDSKKHHSKSRSHHNRRHSKKRRVGKKLLKGTRHLKKKGKHMAKNLHQDLSDLREIKRNRKNKD